MYIQICISVLFGPVPVYTVFVIFRMLLYFESHAVDAVDTVNPATLWCSRALQMFRHRNTFGESEITYYGQVFVSAAFSEKIFLPEGLAQRASRNEFGVHKYTPSQLRTQKYVRTA